MTSPFERMFNPRSIAVAGASNSPGKLGYDFIRRLADGFRGTLTAINPREQEVAGVPAHASLADVPGPIDLLIALIPAERLLPFIQACPSGKASFLAAIPSGFAEMSADGRKQQELLTALARERGMRLLGPNIVGILNGSFGLNASLMPVLPPGGPGLSCLTQSGGFGMALTMYALDRNLPVAKFCDLGNTADVEVHEIVEYLADDPDTRVIGLFLESVRWHDAAVTALAAAAARKPVILTPVGVGAAGRRASIAHLGLQRDASSLVAARPAQVHLAETALDLLNSANALLRQPRSKGRRVAIVTGSGGIGAEVADLCTPNSLELPVFSDPLQAQLRSCLPAYAALQNPVDLTPIWWDYPRVYPQVLEAIGKFGEVDLVVVCITDVPTQYPDLANAIAAWLPSASVPSMIVFWGARDRDCAGMNVLEEAGLPCYRSTREAVAAALALTIPS
jgi:acetate---CoA ligase (ADP-forming)